MADYDIFVPAPAALFDALDHETVAVGWDLFTAAPTSLVSNLTHNTVSAGWNLFAPVGVGGGVVTTHYSLTAVCITDGLRHYWTDTDISLVNAPACIGGYVVGSLTVLGSWKV